MNTFDFKAMFAPNYERYEGVRPVQIHLMRLGYLLVFILVGNISWSAILTHEGGLGSAYGCGDLHVGGFLGLVGARIDQSAQVDPARVVRDRLQDHLARRRRLSALGDEPAGGFAR